jgi:hypothetical protein
MPGFWRYDVNEFMEECVMLGIRLVAHKWYEVGICLWDNEMVDVQQLGQTE